MIADIGKRTINRKIATSLTRIEEKREIRIAELSVKNNLQS